MSKQNTQTAPMPASQRVAPGVRPKISDALHAEVERLLYCAVSELVFAIKHAQHDELDDACTCLVQATKNINQVADKLCKL